MNDNLFLTTYKKNLGKNHMIISPCNQEQMDNHNFRIRMIHENNIEGLLNTHVQYLNDSPSFQYDITGLQSLQVILDTTPVTYSLLCKIFTGIYKGLISLENYLLSHDHILLLPEHIYLSADYSDIYLCYYPLNNEDFTHSVRSFFDYILKNVDHNDEKCVYLAYSMHRYCNDSGFTINELYNKLSLTGYKHQETSDLKNQETFSDNNFSSDKSISSKTFSSKNTFSETDNKPLYQEIKPDTEISTELNFSNIKLPDKRVIFLISFFIIGVVSTTALFLLNVYPVSFYITLLVTLSVITAYNGYHLYRQRDNKVYVTPEGTTSNTFENDITPSIDYGTVLLTSSGDDNTHKLIYTGTGEGNDISITHFPFVIGKTDSCSAKVQNSVISRLHAKLTLMPSDSSHEIFIEDLNSTNGTLLNNVPLTPYEKYMVVSGDYITFGHLTYIFR